jgi:RNA polymerase sigma-70 factor, ECF subfamily
VRMAATSPSTTPEQELVDAARGGDGDAFGRLAEEHRAELLAHCYRMLGSLHDAEDALQETVLRAWRGLPGFADRSSLRTWLYLIATNVCLDAIARRPRRALPVDYGPPSDPTGEIGEPLVGRFKASAVEVLTLEDSRIKDITAFVMPELFPRFGLPLELAP